MNILALDIGTSSVKAAVLDLVKAAPLGAVAHVKYALDHPVPEAAELPAERLWCAVVEAARDATRTLPDIQAVGMAVMSPALVLLDAADRPLAPIWTHLDRRSRPAARQTRAAVGEQFLATVGNRPLPGGISVICWRQQHLADPYLSHRVKSYLHLDGWLALRMTGEKAFDPGNASVTGVYNTITDQRWSEHWCDYFAVDRAWLPPVVDGGTTIGHIRAAVAAELGVPAGVPLKLGLADTSSAMLAAGLEPGDLHVVGTTQVLAALTDKPVPDARRITRRHGVGPLFIRVVHNPVGGVALDWMHDLCFKDQSAGEFYQRTLPEARARHTRVVLDPPFLGGDRLEIEAHRAAFRELTLATDRLDLLAAVLHAMVRRHHEALAALDVGTHFKRVVLTGGGAELVHQLIPEYAGAEVQMLDEGSLRGVARLFDLPTDSASCG